MSRVQSEPANIPAYFEFASQEDDFAEEFVLGERIGAQGWQRRGSSMLQAAIVIAAMGAGGWLYLKIPEPWTSWLTAEVSRLVSERRDTPPPAADANSAPVPGMPLAAPPEAREVAAAPGAETGTAVAAAAVDPAATDMSGSSPAEAQGAIAEAASDGAARTNTDTLATPLPPVVVDQADPYQKRAVAVGLHPDLSRAVLAKLSKDDYRNAATAIKRAFAEPPGAAAFVWPREVKGKLAQFEVRFVASASPECRRYVVSVIKDRWSTTAPAMEKCGADVPKGKTARAAAG